MSEEKSPFDLDKSGRIEWQETIIVIVLALFATSALVGVPLYLAYTGRLDLLESIITTAVSALGGAGLLGAAGKMKKK